MRKTALIALLLVLSLVLEGLINSKRPQILGFKEYVDEPITVVAVGDVMLGRSVNTGMWRRNDWSWPFVETASYLKQADLTFGNLESPFGQDCPATNEGMIFCADKRSVQGLMEAGFDVMSLANNHDLNQGLAGLELSNSWLEENGIVGITETEVEFLEVKGHQVAILAVDDVSHPIDQNRLEQRIREAAMISDMVIVSVHWGVEYKAKPNQRQILLGRAMIDAGSDVVLGHHPHWTQTVEEYQDGVIIYSLGNFVFDQMWSEETRRGDVVEFKLDKTGVLGYQVKPIKIYDYGQPRWLTGQSQ